MIRRPSSWFAVALAATALVAAACGSSTATPSAAPTSAPSSAAVPSAAPTAAPSAAPTAAPSAAATSGPATSQPSGSADSAQPSASLALPSFQLPSQDKDLEGRLPGEVNGTKMVKYSFTGASFLASGSSNTKDLTDLLSSLGKTPADMSVAFASDASGGLDLQIGAFRVAGAPADALLAAFLATTRKETPESVMAQATVGGKGVTTIVDPADTSSRIVYIYAKDDILFYLLTPDATLAGATLQVMP